MTEGAAPQELTYGKPPRATQFQKGVSGNPRGRPRNRRKELPYDAVLGRMVTVRESGRERRVTAAEAFILHLTKKGLEGCGASARASLASIEQARQSKTESETKQLAVRIICRTFGLCCIVEDLGMAIRLNETSKDDVRLMLRPWIVEAALARTGKRQLNVDEQREIWAATYRPGTVSWPGWWTFKG